VKDRVLASIVLIAVFILGCLLGAAGSYFGIKKYTKHQTATRDYGPPPPHGRPQLFELLEMTKEQTVRFGEIMKESRRHLDALQMEQRPKIEAVLEETNRKIASILNEKQQKKYQEFLKDLRRWRSREPRGGRFGPPPNPDRKMFFPPIEQRGNEPGAPEYNEHGPNHPR
jgi:hypothetical protein